MMPSSGFFSRLCQILSGRDQATLDRKRKGTTETNSIDPKRARTDNSDWHFDTLYGGGDPMMAFSKSVRMLSDITDESVAAGGGGGGGGRGPQTSSSTSTMMRRSSGIGRPSFLKPLDKAVPLNKRSLADLPMLIPLKPRPQKPPLITPSYLPDEPPFQTSSRRSSLASQSTRSGYQHQPPPPASIYPFTGLTMKPPPASRFLPELNDSDFGQLLRKSYGSTRSVYEQLVNGGKSRYDSGESQASSRTKYEELLQHVIPRASDHTGGAAATRRGQYTEFGLNGPSASVRQPQQETIYLTDDDDDEQQQEEDEEKCENQDETSFVTANNGTFPRRPGSERFFSMNAPTSMFDFDGPRQQQEEEEEEREREAGSVNKSHAPDPVGEMVNSFKEKLQTNTYYRDNVIKDVQQRYGSLFETRKTQIEQERERLSSLKQGTVEQENLMRSKMLNYVASMPSFESLVIEEPPPKEVTPKEVPLPELTPEQLAFVKRKLQTPPHALVIDKFKIQITGDAFRTLDGNTWLNDEVINFYMQLLQYRSEQRRDQGLPKVYSKSTFFLSSLRRSGYSGVRRYTKKVDLFSFDIIVVPVHVNQVHWCMAIIDLRRKAIEYYDSLGAPNNPVLDMLENYLCQESLDKRQVPFDQTGLTKRNMGDCPKQNNGSDCGVFSCMFAEFLTRDHPITFNQSRMQYFRRKMMLEIAQGELIT
uniref:Putative sentrin/sumo-specific protease n=1 Tax=Anopheles braziliensis TaxID=58242 RepID=A0A2M3ZHH4_9DIPT